MILEELNNKWIAINDCETKSGYKSIRLNKECLPDLYLALDSDGHRCLVLFLSKEIDVKLKKTQKKNILINYSKNACAIVITLCDSNFTELFNDLIISLHNTIKGITEPQIQSQKLIYAFYKWVELFEPESSKKLTTEQINGLFGELFILRELLKVSSSNNTDELLDSWKGPYETSNDFIFDTRNIEVKAKLESKPFVRISSEHQLNKEFDKGLELSVVSLKIDLVNGESVYDVLSDICKIIRENLGDVSILYHALIQLGLTVVSTIEYNNHRFLVSKIHVYDCGKTGFPCLCSANIPNEISNLKYNLRITTLKEFLIQEKQYEI